MMNSLKAYYNLKVSIANQFLFPTVGKMNVTEDLLQATEDRIESVQAGVNRAGF